MICDRCAARRLPGPGELMRLCFSCADEVLEPAPTPVPSTEDPAAAALRLFLGNRPLLREPPPHIADSRPWTEAEKALIPPEASSPPAAAEPAPQPAPEHESAPEPAPVKPRRVRPAPPPRPTPVLSDRMRAKVAEYQQQLEAEGYDAETAHQTALAAFVGRDFRTRSLAYKPSREYERAFAYQQATARRGE